MITIASTNGYFSTTFQADFKSSTEGNVYTLSRSMLRVKRESNPQLSIVEVWMLKDGGGVGDNIIKTYYTDPSGALELPLRNQINAYNADGVTKFNIAVIVKDLDGTVVDGQVTLDLYIYEGVSRYDLRVPNSPYPQASQHGIYVIEPHMEIFPPTVMCIQSYGGLNAADQLYSGIVVESTMESDHNGAWSWGRAGTYTPITATGTRKTNVIVNNRALSLKFASIDANWEWNLQVLSYWNCQEAVVVRWKSLTGATRQHWFPVVGYVKDVDKELSLLTAGDGYDVRKNPTLGLRCRLTGLTDYDVWYYQDLLQASNVHAISRTRWQNMPPFLTAINSTLTECYVEGGVPQTPDGKGFYDFEFIIKMKHYDTI